MTPREIRFLKALVEGGLISFKEAGSLEETQEKLLSETGEHKPVWDIAVDEGVVTSAQAERLLKKVGEDPAARTPEPAVQENTQALAPVKPAEGRSSRRKLGGYGLISKLGQGGMGAVYKAHQESMDRTVAIKVLPRDLAKNQDFIGRFLREAKAAGRLSHPNIVRGIDAGFADGYYYFAMEYVEGSSLGQRLGEEDALAEGEVVDIGRQMADALEHAHAEGIVHRDVKPENILLTPEGQAKLCDLGLARSTGGEDLRVTQAGQAVGTPYYISPEQVRGEEPDARADIYSLGCTLYHLAGGSPPFTGDNQMAVMQKHLTDTAAPLRQLSPGISPALERVVAKMMARDSEDRYQTAAEVAADLHRMAAGGVPSALTAAIAERRAAGRGRRRGTRDTRAPSTGVTRPIGGAEAAALALDEDTADTRALPDAGGRRPPWKLIAIAGALLVLVAAVIGVVLLKGDEPPPPVVAPPPIVEPAEDEDLKKLAGEFAGLGAFAEENPKDYAGLIKRYTEFLGRAAGSEYEEKAQQALAAVNDRQKADQSAERLKKLAADLKAIEAYEQKNPRKFAEIISKYTGFAAGAAGTDFEAKAKSAAAATRKRRGEQARKLLAETRRQVGAAKRADKLGDALARIAAFPGLYFPDVKAELAALETEVRAAGKKRWGETLAEAQKLSEARKFDAARKKATSARSLGLAALEVDISRALARIEKDRQAYLDIVAAGYRKKYVEFAKEFGKLVKAGEFDEALKKGQALRGKLSPELETRLKENLALASGAAELIKTLNVGLGYSAGDALDIGYGIHLAMSAGDLVDGETFTIEAIANSDETGFLAAAGINTFFSGDSALTIGVRDRVKEDPDVLATIRGTEGTDNKNIARLAELGEATNSPLGDVSMGGFYREMVSGVGQIASVRGARQKAQEQILQQLENRRAEISGVDMNEEAAKLLIFQQMFQGMAHFIRVQNEVLQVLINSV